MTEIIYKTPNATAMQTQIHPPKRAADHRIDSKCSCRVAAYTRLIVTTSGNEYHKSLICTAASGGEKESRFSNL